MFRLGGIIFGTNIVGVNAYYLLRRLIWDYKVNPNQGSKEWSDRLKQLQTYIPYVPSKILDKRGAAKAKFTEIELKNPCQRSTKELPQRIHFVVIEYLRTTVSIISRFT